MKNSLAPITPDRFGKDHWSMLAYVETCCVDNAGGAGNLDLARCRTNPNTHPLLNTLRSEWNPSYGTRLSGFFDLEGRSDPKVAEASGLQILAHDDWDCLDDLESAGYVKVNSLINGNVQMTDLGCKVAGLLRAHKAMGGQFAGFKLPQDEPVDPASVAIERAVRQAGPRSP